MHSLFYDVYLVAIVATTTATATTLYFSLLHIQYPISFCTSSHHTLHYAETSKTANYVVCKFNMTRLVTLQLN